MAKETEKKRPTTKMKVVYCITKKEGDEKGFWNRCGAAFVNSDGSINVKLDMLPLSGELQLRDYVPKEDQLSDD